MQLFSKGELLSPKLPRIKWTTDEDEGFWKSDLNATIQEFYAQKVGYAALRTLKIVEHAESIGILRKKPTEVFFIRKLTVLNVCNITGLRYVLTPSTAVDLVQLIELKVINCDTIEQIIADEEGSQEIISLELVALWLEDLPKLTKFKSGNSLEFSSLKRLRISKCPLLETFISSSSIYGNLTTTGNTSEKIENNYATPLFDTKVAFPKLEVLRIINMRNLNKIWENQLEAHSFCQLNDVHVGQCEKLLIIFPSCMLERLKTLRKLWIWKCDLLESVFESQGHDTSQSQANQPTSMNAPVEYAFPDLTILQLHRLPKLKFFFPQELIITCPTLKKLEVNGCDQMQIFASEYQSFQRVNGDMELEVPTEYHLFSVTKDSFPSLEEFHLGSNSRMEKVWSGMNPRHNFDKIKNDEAEEKIVFAKLKSMYLHDMPRLACFCSSYYDFEFPSLEGLAVMGCPKMQFFSVGKPLTPNLQSVKGTTNEDQELQTDDLNMTLQKLFNQKVGYSTFEYFRLVEATELTALWNMTPQGILSFRMLKVLDVCNISSVRYLFTPTMALELVQLKELKVTNCDSMEEVITEEGSEEIIFPKLKGLKLKDLPKLTRFCSKNYLKFPELLLLMIERCSLLEMFISPSEKDKDFNTPALFNAKVALPKIERLIIDSIGSLSKIWDNQLEADTFCELNYLRVELCGKLFNIFSYDMLKRLQKLEKLRVRNCSSLEEIFENQGHGASESLAKMTTTQPTVVDGMEFTLKFANLTWLELYMLPKLKCVFPRVHTIECPLLKLLEVNGCDEVQVFASECHTFLSTTGDDQQEISPQSPLFWLTKDTFPTLRAMKLGWNDSIKESWFVQDPGSFFPKLMLIELIDFPEQSAQLPSLSVQSLPDFSELVVNGVSREISQEDNASSSNQGGVDDSKGDIVDDSSKEGNGHGSKDKVDGSGDDC